MNVLLFMAVATAFSWSMWILYGASLAGALAFRVPVEVLLLGEHGPALAAYTLLARERGWEGVQDLLRRIVRWRVPLRCYALALLLMPGLMLATLAVGAAMGTPLPEPAQLADWAAHFRARTYALGPSMGVLSSLSEFMALGTWATALGMLALGVSQGGLSEEPGWRGYALPKARERWSLLTSGLIVGAFWAIWHMCGPEHWKLLFQNGTAPFVRASLQSLIEYLIVCLPLGVLYAWLWANSSGSVLLAILLHASYNITLTVVRSGWPGIPILVFFGLAWLLAVVVVVLARRQFLAPPARQAHVLA
jgi:uncharacterized protein